jgi:ribonucleoside-diphosphate reductase alpha chain
MHPSSKAIGSLEPLFGFSFKRNVMDDDELIEVNPCFEMIARKRGFFSKELMHHLGTVWLRQPFHPIPSYPTGIYRIWR